MYKRSSVQHGWVWLHNIYTSCSGPRRHPEAGQPQQTWKTWTNEGAKAVSAILRPQLTVTCNILETSCMKRTKKDQKKGEKPGLKLHFSPVSQRHSLRDGKRLRPGGKGVWWQSHIKDEQNSCRQKHAWTRLGCFRISSRMFQNDFRPFGSRFYRVRRTFPKVLIGQEEATWSRVVSVLDMITVIKCGHFSDIKKKFQ